MDSTLTSENVKTRLERIEEYFKSTTDKITLNLKRFDDIKLENRQSYETINRNLDDVREIYESDLGRYGEHVEKTVAYNQAIYQRVEKDAHYLHDQQQVLSSKIQSLQRRVDEMEAQIGSMQY